MTLHTSAPATLMLMGEHAVLRNHPCLVAATHLRLHVYLTPRTDKQIKIKSILGEYTCTLPHIEVQPPFAFILSLVQQLQKKLPSGFDLEIISEFAPDLGLGSSAATLIATCAALLKFSNQPLDIFTCAKKSLLKVQGQGSGADLAAALTGGIIYYQIKPLTLEKLPCEIPLVAIYSGAKTPTSTVINIINEAEKNNPKIYQDYFTNISKAVMLAKTALLQHDINQLADAFILNQNLMEQMHLNTVNIDYVLKRLNADSGILAAKISGSGLGDCVIGLGQLNETYFPETTFEQTEFIKIIPIKLSALGLIEHE
jgi:mevalonate kinase